MLVLFFFGIIFASSAGVYTQKKDKHMDSLSFIIDTLYVLFAMTLIIFMVPGFAMLEAGIVRTKNVTAVLTINILI